MIPLSGEENINLATLNLCKRKLGLTEVVPKISKPIKENKITLLNKAKKYQSIQKSQNKNLLTKSSGIKLILKIKELKGKDNFPKKFVDTMGKRF